MDTLKILLVDDDRSLVTTLSHGLRKAMGDSVLIDVCFSGPEALSMLLSQSFDLVISDFNLPGMSGLDLLAAIRRDQPETTLILITAFGNDELEQEAGRQSIGYLTKPFEPPLLAQLVRARAAGRRVEPTPLTIEPDSPTGRRPVEQGKSNL